MWLWYIELIIVIRQSPNPVASVASPMKNRRRQGLEVDHLGAEQHNCSRLPDVTQCEEMDGRKSQDSLLKIVSRSQKPSVFVARMHDTPWQKSIVFSSVQGSNKMIHEYFVIGIDIYLWLYSAFCRTLETPVWYLSQHSYHCKFAYTFPIGYFYFSCVQLWDLFEVPPAAATGGRTSRDKL